jgi:hypothetical protein
MTLTHLRPGRMNSTKLFAFVLLALGVMAFAYQNLPDASRVTSISPATPPMSAEKAAVVTPAIVLGIIALASGLVVLVIERMEPVE